MAEETVTHPTPSRSQRRWWKETSVYQIYPSSFNDTNADGIGDIPGIIQKLDYLHDLGVDMLWLSPVYKSPGKDMGYDISDYLDIDPKYGTMKDMDELIAGVHQRGMKLLMDLVVNHTSDQHEWFLDSRSSKQSRKRDWYIWRDPLYDEHGHRQPPNNWLAVFGGSVWEWDEPTGQYYLHCFLPSQPDLNWEQPEVRKAVHSMMKFWLDKKVDGFRQDVINLISKAPGLPDAPIILPGENFQPAYTLFSNGPRLHEFLQEMRSEVLDKYDVMVVGEMPWLTDRDEVLKVVGADRRELDMIFQFDIVEMDFGNNGRFSWPEKPWDLVQMKGILEDWQTYMISHDGWNSIFIENHDHPRSVSRFVDRKLTDNDPVVRTRVCKMLATLCAGQSGTLYIYQGQELGMKNIPEDWDISEYKDIESQNKYKHALEQANGDITKISSFMEALHLKARDNGRTPVQWDSSSHGGFTTGTPWMRVNNDYEFWNASLQVYDKSSVFAHWKRILVLRKQYKDVLIYGDFEMLSKEDPAIIAYRRVYGEQQALVVMNFTNKEVRWEPPQERGEIVALLEAKYVKLKNYGELRIEGGGIALRAFEAAIFIGGHLDLDN
ncbi:oligo-1,6-glucosidase [Trichophaea hybrida]|nr:oligo-1,6-glucosidase [Trichophaea hybrida]